MSPEQVQGQDVDQRGDIFSLGVVLYELFTGQLPFKGLHETALMYEIVNVDALPMSSVKPEIDPNLDAIVLECLAKEPSERYQSVAEVGKELRRFKRESSKSRMSHVTTVRNVTGSSTQNIQIPHAVSVIESTQSQKARQLIFISTSLIFFFATIVMTYLYWRTSSKETSSVRFTIPVPENGAFQAMPPIISPDGLKLAYVALDSSGKSMLWLRLLRTTVAEPLKGTDLATYPFWSFDSRFIGFFQNGKLKKIEVTGGPAQTIAEAPEGRGGTWGSSGVIVFSPSYNSGLQQVSDAGGLPTQLTVLDSTRNEDSHRWPDFLPDGRHFTYLRRSSSDEKTAVYLGSLDSKEYSLLLLAKSNTLYTNPGYLLFVREQTLMAQPFVASSGKLSGQAIPVIENAGFDQAYTLGLFSASANGIIALGMGLGSTGNRQLVWFDRNGKRLGTVGTAGLQFDFSLAPDEKRVIIRRLDSQAHNHDLWMIDVIRQTESRFTFSPAVDDDPVWSSDGATIFFDSNPEGIPNIHRKTASGVGNEELLLKSSVSNVPLSSSPDGRYLLFVKTDQKTKEDLWILPLTGDRKPFPYLQTAASEYCGQFSPDGRWIAFASNESGKFEVYVQAFPTSQGKWQVSTGGGAHPVWSKNGKEIFYLAPDKKLMAVDIKPSGTSFEEGIPKPLFTTNVDAYDSFNRFVVSNDGKRFLINSSIEGKSSEPIMVILNWTAEVKK